MGADIHIEIEDRDNYLFIKAQGMLSSIEDRKSLGKRFYDEIIGRDFRKALIDESGLVTFMDKVLAKVTTDYYLDFEKFPEMQNLKIAVVHKEEDREGMEFWELYSRNRGLDFKVFFRAEEAENWITG